MSPPPSHEIKSLFSFRRSGVGSAPIAAARRLPYTDWFQGRLFKESDGINMFGFEESILISFLELELLPKAPWMLQKGERVEGILGN